MKESPKIIVTDLDNVLFKNHLLTWFLKITPNYGKKLNKHRFLKRIWLRCFEIFEFFALQLWLEYEINKELVTYLISEKEQNDALIAIVTDRSRLGISNVFEYLAPLGKIDFIQIRKGFPYRKHKASTRQGKNLKDTLTDIYECPWVKPDIRVLNEVLNSSATLVIDDDQSFRDTAKKCGYDVILDDYVCINDPESFMHLLKRRLSRA